MTTKKSKKKIEVNKEEIAKRISQARCKLQRDNIFFSYLVLHLDMKEGDHIQGMDTACVDNNGNLYYNTKFVAKLKDDELQGLLCHEVLHVAFEHAGRYKERQHDIWNVATDIAINTILVNNKFILPVEGIKPAYAGENRVVLKGTGISIEHTDEKTAEEIYDELYKKAKAKGLIQEVALLSPKDFEEVMKGANGSGKDMKGVKEKVKGLVPVAGKGKDGMGKGKDWKQILTDAAIISKMRGQMPNGIDRYFDNLFNEKLDWRQLLQRYISSSIPTDYTFMRPHKKSVATGFYMPNIIKEQIEVVVAVDTSGSIGKEELDSFMNEVIGILKCFSSVNITLIACDAKVNNVYNNVDNPSQITGLRMTGGGGTDADPIVKWLQENKPDTQLWIYFTDGWSYLTKNPFPSIWVIKKQGGSFDIPKRFDNIEVVELE